MSRHSRQVSRLTRSGCWLPLTGSHSANVLALVTWRQACQGGLQYEDPSQAGLSHVAPSHGRLLLEAHLILIILAAGVAAVLSQLGATLAWNYYPRKHD